MSIKCLELMVKIKCNHKHLHMCCVLVLLRFISSCKTYNMSVEERAFRSPCAK